MKVLFYGRLAESIAPQVEFDVHSGCTVSELRGRLISTYPQAGEALRSGRSRACVGDTLVKEEHLLGGEERVEFLPPVSGG